MSDNRVILHCDMNNFFASVEIQLHPELKGKAVAVCGDPERRHGIVLAKSIRAKAAGVSTGEPIWQAKRKCPDLIVVMPTFKKYIEYSKKVFNIYVQYTSEVESFGLDECWLDVTGSRRLFGSGEEIAYKIKEQVKAETGLTISVGVSFTKVFAKLGSDMKKPDAVSVVSRENYKQVAWRLPVGDMLFVGRSMAEKLKRLNIKTIGDLANADVGLLKMHFGKQGEKLSEYANGADNEPVACYTDKHIPESIGNGTTTQKDVTNLSDAESVIYSLCEMIGFRLRQYGLIAQGVSINLRNTFLSSFSRQGRIDPSGSASDIAAKAIDLLKTNYDFGSNPPIRTITVGTFNLIAEDSYVQMSMFNEHPEKSKKLDKAIDGLRGKYGYGVLKRCANINTVFTCDSKEADDDFIPFDKRSRSDGKDA